MSETVLNAAGEENFRQRCRSFLDDHATGIHLRGEPDPRSEARLRAAQKFQKALADAGRDAELTVIKGYSDVLNDNMIAAWPRLAAALKDLDCLQARSSNKRGRSPSVASELTSNIAWRQDFDRFTHFRGS